MPSGNLSKRAAEQCKAELATIRKLDRKGLLRPELGVKWARKNRASELAKHLEWDDSVAGEAYRIEQVRNIITFITFKEETTQTLWRSYVSVPSDRVHGGGYRPTTDALRSARKELIAEAVGCLTTIRHRYTHLPELAPLFDAVEKLADRYRDSKAA